ncbi:hypothetical protein GCM10025771_08390 [Niveibacterium umoris]
MLCRCFWAASLGLCTLLPVACSNGQPELAQAIEGCRRGVRFDAKQRSALDSTKAFVACVDSHAGKDGQRLFAEKRAIFDALPHHPCEYVGIWAATRSEQHYRMVLDEDGSFRGQAYSDTRQVTSGMTGSWGVAGQRIVWMYDTGLTWPPDINTIRPIGKNAFELDEVDGSTTRYDLLDRSPFERCAPPS